jgi:hypothetical protein
MFGFRVPQTPNAGAKLERIKQSVEAIYKALRNRKEDEHKVINRNDILLEALEKGLAQIKKDESV